jgi:hypothetical protein
MNYVSVGHWQLQSARLQPGSTPFEGRRSSRHKHRPSLRCPPHTPRIRSLPHISKTPERHTGPQERMKAKPFGARRPRVILFCMPAVRHMFAPSMPVHARARMSVWSAKPPIAFKSHLVVYVRRQRTEWPSKGEQKMKKMRLAGDTSDPPGEQGSILTVPPLPALLRMSEVWVPGTF